MHLFKRLHSIILLAAVCSLSILNSMGRGLPETLLETDTIQAPLYKAGKYLLVEGKLNGKPAFFLVDTGASYSILHQKLARRYGFQLVDLLRQEATGFGGNSSRLQVAVGASIGIGTREASMGFLAQDLYKIIRFIHQESNMVIAGIIGSDFLSRFRCKLDIRQNIMQLEASTPRPASLPQ